MPKFRKYAAPRRGTARFVALVTTLTLAPLSRAEDLSVPVQLQATLLVKVASYDRNMAVRAPGKVNILIVQRANSNDSGLAATQLQKALAQEKQIAGRPHETSIINFSSASDLAKACQEKHAAIIYL